MAIKQKLTLYFPPELLEEARLEAQRQERTISWILQKAWEFARHDIHRLPSANAPLESLHDMPSDGAKNAMHG